MTEWWRGAVIYQIYPRSFSDSDDDGVGDLRGVSSKLDYVKSLGVDGVWLSPFFRSPMRDFGYDVSDYRDVDPIFGSLADFDGFFPPRAPRSLKVVIDQVYSHTSDQHPWFKESRRARDKKADWYVWADAKDGRRPAEQLDLYFRRSGLGMGHAPAAILPAQFSRRAARSQFPQCGRPPRTFSMLRNSGSTAASTAFVSMSRISSIATYGSATIRRSTKGGGFARPYQHQRHLHDRSQPETLGFMEELRRLLDNYPDRMSVAEIVSDPYAERSAEYCAPGRLHTAYNFLFLLENGPLSARFIRSAIESWTERERVAELVVFQPRRRSRRDALGRQGRRR